MDQSPNLGLPYILAAQQQKHVTHNEAVRALDCMVQLTVLDRNLATPPALPLEGARYIVDAAPTGAWSGQAGRIAAYQDAGWIFYAPIEGWITWVADENVALVFDGAAWVPLTTSGSVTSHGALTGLGNDDHLQYFNAARGDARYLPLAPATLGVNATADTTNRLAIGSAASLFNHQGTGGHQIKINKAAIADTASFLFQTAFSGRAELGTTGDDDFHFKVSPNGASWSDAILINRTTGSCSFPNTSLGAGTVTSVASGNGIAGGPITGSGTLSLANMPATSLKGNSAGASAAPADLTPAQVKTMLAIATIDVSGLAAIATSGSASNLIAGTVPAAQMPAHTGDATSTGGSVALTIAPNAVTNAKAAQMAASTIKGNSTGAAANATDLTAAQVKTLLAISSADVSGLGSLATASTVNLSTQVTGTLAAAQEPAHTGDVTNTAGSLALTIAANAVTNAKAAQMAASTLKGNNTAGAANAADLTAAQVKTLLAISSADVTGLGALATASTVNLSTQATGTLAAAQEPAHTGDVTNAAGSLALTIAVNAVTNAKAAQMAASTIKGNNTGASANAADLTGTQVTALLDSVTSAAKGLAPASGGGTTNFLRADGTWSAPPASGTPGGTSGQIEFNNGGTFGGFTVGGDATLVTSTGALTIAANAVTNAKAAQMAASTIKGNNTAGAANSADLTAAQAKTLLAISSADVAGLGALATASTVNLSTQATGTLAAAQEPAHTGDVTNTAGSLALTIAANAVSNAKTAQMAATTIKGNNTGATANVADLTAAQVAQMLPTFGASGAAHAQGLVPDPGATAGAVRYLREDGTWFTPAGGGTGSPGGTVGQVQFNNAGAFAGVTVGGDATLDTSTGILAIAANAVTNAKAALMPAKTIKANITGAAANAADITPAQLAALIPISSMEYQIRTSPILWTDFGGGAAAQQGFAAGAGIGGGTSITAPSGFANSNHVGIQNISSSATANSGYFWTFMSTGLLLSGNEQFDCIFRTPTVLTTVTTRMGFHDSSSSLDSVDGCYFEWIGSGAVVAKTSNNSVRTTSATVATLLPDTWYHARVKLNAAATAADFTIYSDTGTQVGTTQITTNIPTASLRETTATVIATSSGTVAVNVIYLDYMSLSFPGRQMARGALF